MIDAHQRVTGRIAYTLNVSLPGLRHAKLLRSTAPHARIKRIDVARARALRGVDAVVTGADLAARADLSPYFGPVFRDQPILAIDKVRYVGEPVVGVVAVDADTAQRAIDLIEVEYEELPAILDMDAALAPGATLVHEGTLRRASLFADVVLNPRPGTNVCNYFRLRKGDVATGFAQADHVFEDVFTIPPIQAVPLETHV
jgi:CO/xanthine dehydrogenase Mo-binding subunit